VNPFPPTRWTLILSAKDGENKASRDAMDSLAQAYWQPIYAWLRGRGRSHEEAQDDTQGFFAYLLDRRFLGNIQPQGGRFRNFLLVCLRRWMKDECHRATNLKQREEVGMHPWHEKAETALFSREIPPDEAFDRAWVTALVARTMAALEQRWENRAELFAALRPAHWKSMPASQPGWARRRMR
jgi:DNA-directed RNA polymerase specialized sigma24 family protein